MVVDKLLNQGKVVVGYLHHFLAGHNLELVGFFDKFSLELVQLKVKIMSVLEHGLAQEVNLGDLFTYRDFLALFGKWWVRFF